MKSIFVRKWLLASLLPLSPFACIPTKETAAPILGRNDRRAAVQFSDQKNAINRTNTFTYPSTVFAHVTFEQKLSGLHRFRLCWIDPNGEPQEESNLNLDFGPSGGSSTVFWLEFRERSIFDDIRLGSHYGHHENAISGEWRLQVVCDDHILSESTFRINT